MSLCGSIPKIRRVREIIECMTCTHRRRCWGGPARSPPAAGRPAGASPWSAPPALALCADGWIGGCVVGQRGRVGWIDRTFGQASQAGRTHPTARSGRALLWHPTPTHADAHAYMHTRTSLHPIAAAPTAATTASRHRCARCSFASCLCGCTRTSQSANRRPCPPFPPTNPTTLSKRAHTQHGSIQHHPSLDARRRFSTAA